MRKKNFKFDNTYSKLPNSFYKKVLPQPVKEPKLIEINLKDVEEGWPENLPKGIIHADLFHDNIFFKNDNFSGFIDFYFSANDFLSYELATCINALCFKKKNRKFVLDKKRSSNLLKGYQSVRKLSEIEKRNLNTLCRGSALRYLLTRSYDYLNTPKNAVIKIKDPKEYIDKLNFHRNLSTFKDYS